MANKQPKPNNIRYIVGGQLIPNPQIKGIEMPPKNSNNAKIATQALNEGNFMTINAADNIVVKDKYGEVITRIDGKDGKGKVLTTREKKNTRTSSRNNTKGQQNSAYDRG